MYTFWVGMGIGQPLAKIETCLLPWLRGVIPTPIHRVSLDNKDDSKNCNNFRYICLFFGKGNAGPRLKFHGSEDNSNAVFYLHSTELDANQFHSIG